MRFVALANSAGGSPADGYFNSLLHGCFSWASTEADKRAHIVEAVDLVHIVLDIVDPGGVTSRTFTVRVNGSDTAAVVVVNSGTTRGTWSGTLSLAPGDIVTLRHNDTGTPANINNSQLRLEFESPTDYRSYVWSRCAMIGGTTLYHAPFSQQSNGWETTAGRATVVAPISGTIPGYSLRATTQASTSLIYTIYKNGVAQDGTGGTPDTRLTISAGSTTATYTTSTFNLAFSQGDELYMRCDRTSGGTGPSFTVASLCVAIDATTAHESIICNTMSSALGTTNGPVYVSLSDADSQATNATESGVQSRPGLTSIQLDRFYFHITAPPGSGNTRAFTLRKNAADTAVVANFGATDVAMPNVSGSLLLADGDTASIKCTGTSTPDDATLVFSARLIAQLFTTVPNIVGLSEAAGDSSLVAASLISGTVTYAFDAVVALGLVISQSPTSGSSALIGSDVDYVVSLGVEPPDLTHFNGGLAHAYVFPRALTAADVARHYRARLGGSLSGEFMIQKVLISNFEAGAGKKFPVRTVEAGTSREADLADLLKPKE